MSIYPGIISFQLKNYKKSYTLIAEAIKINPKDAEAYNNMGIVLNQNLINLIQLIINFVMQLN